MMPCDWAWRPVQVKTGDFLSSRHSSPQLRAFTIYLSPSAVSWLAIQCLCFAIVQNALLEPCRSNRPKLLSHNEVVFGSKFGLAVSPPEQVNKGTRGDY